MGFLTGLTSYRTTKKNKATEALIHDDLVIIATGLDSIGAAVNIVDITYANLSTLKATSALAPNTTYYITDRDIGVDAVTTSELSIEGIRKMRTILNTFYTVAGINLGVWNSTLTPAMGNIVVWGGRVWTNILGNAGTSIDDRYLDPIEWAVAGTSDPVKYEDKLFKVIYDFDNDWVSSQSDDRGNTFGVSFIVNQNIGLSYNQCNISDWGNENIFDNNVWGVYNNSNSGQIYFNSNAGGIYNNSNSEDIYFNSNSGQIYNNSNNGGIFSNSNAGDIFNNSNAGSIHNNSNSEDIYSNSNAGYIFNNINTGGIYNNSNIGSIYRNTNNGDTSFNSNAGSIYNNSNAGDTSLNSSNGQIYNNSNNGGISSNSNAGDIFNNANGGGIYNNSNNGQIDNNSNSREIYYNTQTSGTCNITSNNNNGNIGGARTANVIGTIVNL